MAKPNKTVFIADDDQEFETEHQRDAHDEYLRSAGNIEAYIVTRALHKVQAGLLRRVLPDFMAWRAANPNAKADLPVKASVAEEAVEA